MKILSTNLMTPTNRSGTSRESRDLLIESGKDEKMRWSIYLLLLEQGPKTYHEIMDALGTDKPITSCYCNFLSLDGWVKKSGIKYEERTKRNCALWKAIPKPFPASVRHDKCGTCDGTGVIQIVTFTAEGELPWEVKRPSHATKKKPSKAKQLNLFPVEKKNEKKRVSKGTGTDSSSSEVNRKTLAEERKDRYRDSGYYIGPKIYE